jgi:mRNA-degrading endonuclease RelE of RelBE toxin-antitoxin system
MPYEVKLHREVVKILSKMKPDVRSRIIRGLHQWNSTHRRTWHAKSSLRLRRGHVSILHSALATQMAIDRVRHFSLLVWGLVS